MSFGEKIKKLRRQANLTQEQLANLLSISPQAISRWENGAAMPDISLLVPLANLFHVSTDHLLGIEEETEEDVIRDLIDKAALFHKSSGFDEHLSKYKAAVLEHPHSQELKDAYLMLLETGIAIKKTDENKAKEEIRRICRQILAMDVSEERKREVRNILSRYSTIEEEKELASLLDKSNDIEHSYQVLLPKNTAGKERIEAYKKLIFSCANIVCDSIYDLFAEHSQLTDDEFSALLQAENFLGALYGQKFADNFILIKNRVLVIKALTERNLFEEAYLYIEDYIRILTNRAPIQNLSDFPSIINAHDRYILATSHFFGVGEMSLCDFIAAIPSFFPKEEQTSSRMQKMITQLKQLSESFIHLFNEEMLLKIAKNA